MTHPAPAPERIELRPQAGPQERFARCTADIAVYGGAAGGGKSYALLMEPLYHVANPHFGATIFRRTYPQITAQGGLWGESQAIYPLVGGRPNVADHRWDFPAGSQVKFAHLQHEATVLAYQGAQIALIGFDELTHFTEHQFTYLLSRSRSTCGVRPYVRATTNPDAASWVARWVDWYIDPATGYPIPDRAGRVRWFVRDGDMLRWANTREELRRDHPEKADFAKSFTFVPASLEDNKILQAKDPGYKANIEAQSRVERERLGKGNWLVSNAEGEWPAEYFGRHLYLPAWPPDPGLRTSCVIAWDPSKGTDSRWGDFSAFAVLLRDSAGQLAADVLARQNWSVEEAIDAGLELAREYHPDAFVVESNQFQALLKPLIQARCRALGLVPPPLYLIDNRVNKEVRVRRLGPYLANRTLRVRGGSPGARLLAEQLMTFPNGDHDDAPDALEMALRTMIRLVNGKPRPGSPRGR